MADITDFLGEFRGTVRALLVRMDFFVGARPNADTCVVSTARARRSAGTPYAAANGTVDKCVCVPGNANGLVAVALTRCKCLEV